jgi:hypothetical protein
MLLKPEYGTHIYVIVIRQNTVSELNIRKDLFPLSVLSADEPPAKRRRFIN